MRIVGIAGIGMLVATGCGSYKPEAKGPDFEGVQCSAVRPQTEPDLMAWDPGSRLNLKALSSQGVVAVRYHAQGCDVQLEVLSNCIGDGKYEYEGYSAVETKLARNATELFAELPLGAASLEGKFKGGRELRTDYVLVGARSLKAGVAFPRSALRGTDCQKATHIVTRLYLGGFAMAAGSFRSGHATGSLFGAGAGAKEFGASEVIRSEGDAEACEEARRSGRETPQCQVPLRVGLQPLDPDTGLPGNPPPFSTCPPGMVMQGNQCIAQPAATNPRPDPDYMAVSVSNPTGFYACLTGPTIGGQPVFQLREGYGQDMAPPTGPFAGLSCIAIIPPNPGRHSSTATRVWLITRKVGTFKLTARYYLFDGAGIQPVPQVVSTFELTFPNTPSTNGYCMTGNRGCLWEITLQAAATRPHGMKEMASLQ